jgi:hypothetical protein
MGQIIINKGIERGFIILLEVKLGLEVGIEQISFQKGVTGD